MRRRLRRRFGVRFSSLHSDTSKLRLFKLIELTEEERSHILSAPEFLDFVEQSSKIVQRALNDGYDYIRDYTIGTEANGCVSFYFAYVVSVC